MNHISPDDQSVAAGLSASLSEVQLPTLGTGVFVYSDFALFLHMSTRYLDSNRIEQTSSFQILLCSRIVEVRKGVTVYPRQSGPQ
jgi:hypothetical protein